MKDLYAGIAKKLSDRNITAKITIVDSTAMEFYGISATLPEEIEFEFSSDHRGWNVLMKILEYLKVKAYFGEDISR